MNQYDCMLAFVRTYEAGSFSGAARALRVSQPTISKRIAELEQQFGVTLFARTTRKLHPTTEALRAYEHVRQAIAAFDTARASVADVSPTPTGTLRVAAPMSFGRANIVPRIGAYLATHPGVTLELRFTERTVDLVGEGVEVGIRIGALPSSSLIARRIGTAERVVVASRAYLKRHTPPRTPEDLADHDCVVHTAQKQADRWTFDSETGRHVVEVKGRLWIDDIDAVSDAVLGGLGIGLVPLWCVRGALAAGKAVTLLADYHAAALPVSAVYPDAEGLSLRARSFIDFLADDLMGAPPARRAKKR
jgi:DNA-binding transcriptional LysR family regulator